MNDKEVTARMYATTDDLHRMRQMAATIARDYGDCGVLHVGDITHRIFNIMRSRPPQEIVRLWMDSDGQLLAWVIVYGRFRGFDWLVHPALHGSALEAEVLDWAEAHTKREFAMAENRVDYGVDVTDADTHTVELFTKRNYRMETDRDTWAHLTSLSLRAPIAEPVLPEGYTIRTSSAGTGDTAANQNEAAKLAEVHNGAFGSGWTAQSYGAYMLSPGYALGTEMVVEAPDGRLAAFCFYWLDPITKSGLFEPVGAHGDFRRRGLTKALLYAALHQMKAAGVETAFVRYEASNPAAAALYASVGFRKKYTTRWFRLPKDAADL